jgi:hypothetical protein
MTAPPDDFATAPLNVLELNFRRLLRKCEATAKGEETSWKANPVFHAVRPLPPFLCFSERSASNSQRAT